MSKEEGEICIQSLCYRHLFDFYSCRCQRHHYAIVFRCVGPSGVKFVITSRETPPPPPNPPPVTVPPTSWRPVCRPDVVSGDDASSSATNAAIAAAAKALPPQPGAVDATAPPPPANAIAWLGIGAATLLDEGIVTVVAIAAAAEVGEEARQSGNVTPPQLLWEAASQGRQARSMVTVSTALPPKATMLAWRLGKAPHFRQSLTPEVCCWAE